MGRWGQEEKKSQGLLGCFAALLLLAASIFVFSRVYPVLEGRKQLEARIQKISQGAHRLLPKEVEQRVMDVIRDLDLPVDQRDVTVTMVMDKNGTRNLTVKVSYVDVVDLEVWQKEVPVQINKVTPLIEF